ncbi:MAG: hypothetical protein AYK18_17505 [Theionarchaea archaeon DG-70]|nr:MAG: hypothetical protein AYK18_17505 [Theionarchaea archaeon DG-70]
MFSIIRDLERVRDLCGNHKADGLRECTLYFLGYFYYKVDDLLTAKERLRECVTPASKIERFVKFFKPKSSTEQIAYDLLDNIWSNKIKPPWWRWWLFSPSSPFPKRIIFGFFLLIIFLFLLSPMLFGWLSSVEALDWLPPIIVDSTVALVVFVLSIFVLLSPSISSIKAKDVEIEMSPPSAFEHFLSPSMMEERIGELET